MLESDLYAPVKRFLERQGYVVKGEIGACDVVAVRGEEPPVIVELKRAFGIELLLQGVNRQSVTDVVYLAIPKPKRDRTAGAAQLCRRLGLGLLVVAPRSVEAIVAERRRRARDLRGDRGRDQRRMSHALSGALLSRKTLSSGLSSSEI